MPYVSTKKKTKTLEKSPNAKACCGKSDNIVRTRCRSVVFPQMNNSCLRLLNHKNFKCFSKSNTDVKTYDCDIEHAEWVYTENGYKFSITANRFLRNMVRSIVGTMIEIGTCKITDKDLQKILDSEDRREAGYSVPASGLFLSNVTYKNIFETSWKK